MPCSLIAFSSFGGSFSSLNEFERLIFTKNDGSSTIQSKYKGLYINDPLYQATLKVDDIVLDDGELKQWDGSTLITPTTLEDTSFTLSYSLDDGVWVSYHSYKPVNYMSKDFTFYSYINDKLYRHNSKDTHSIYDNIFDFEIELIFNQDRELIKKFNQMSWFVEFFDKNGNRIEDIDFSEIIPTTNGIFQSKYFIVDDSIFFPFL